MKKQYFSPEQDGFYGVYYSNPTSSSQAMIALLGIPHSRLDIDEKLSHTILEWCRES